MLTSCFFRTRARWVLLGLGLMVLAAPIGDARDLLFENWGLWSSTRKYYDPFEFDRAVGRLVLFLGWCCIARGLGGNRTPAANADASRLSRLPFRLRWLPVPILVTTGLYIVLAFREADAQLLVVDISNPPSGTQLEVGGQNTVTSLTKNRYAEALEYLFGIPLPRGGWLPTFRQAHVEFRAEHQRLGLQNWQPKWSWLFVAAKDEARQQGLLVFLNLRFCADGPDVIDVGSHSAVACSDWHDDGRCLVQNAYYRLGAKQIRVKVDLAGLEPEKYQDHFPRTFDTNLGGKWPECRPGP